MRARFLVFAAAAIFVCADAYAQFVPGQPVTPSAPPAPPAAGSAQAPAPPPSAAPPSSAAPSTSAAPPSAPPASAAPPPSAPPPSPPAPPASAAPAAPAPPATSAPPPAGTAPEAAAPPPGMAGETFTTHRAAESPGSDWDVKGLLGLEVEARGGFMLPESASPITAPGLLPGMAGPYNPTGDLLNGNMSPYSYDPFAVALAAGYRFFPFLSAGLYFDYGNFQVNGGCDTATVQCTDGTSQLQRQLWQLGVYGRYYLTTLHKRLQPWVEIGIGATEDTSSYTRMTGGNIEVTNYYLTYWGLATNLKVGLDWRLSPWFSIGPFVGYSRVFPMSGEVQVCPQSANETGNCDTTSPYYKDTSSAPVTTSGYGLFFAGIFLKVTLGPSLR